MAVTRPAPLPGSWTFYAYTTIGGVPLGPVQCTAFQAQRILSGFGTGSVTVPYGNGALTPDLLLRLWSWKLWAFYNGSPVWGGFATGLADQAEGAVTLTMTELPGYLTKRVIDTVGGLSYTQAEQTGIAAILAGPLADVGIPVVTDAGPGHLIDAQFDYLGSTDRAQLLTTLSQDLSGPEFRAEYYTDAGGLPQCQFKIAYPRVGASTGLGLVVPGSATAYTGTWDSDRLRTRTFAVGSAPQGDTSGTATAPVVMLDQPQPDLPRLDAVDDWQDVSVLSVLTARANTAAAQYAQPAASITGTVPVGLPALGTYSPGDDVALRITDPLMPGGLVGTARLTEMDIDAAAGTVALTCVTMTPPPRPRDTLAARLAHINVQLARLSHQDLAPVSTQQEAP